MIGMSVVEASQWALSATAKVVPTSVETIKAGAAQ
jgi:hypothetical protein